MKVLAVAHVLPPALYPQSIQIGRLLSRLSVSHKVFVATADQKTANRCDAYEDLDRKMSIVRVPSCYEGFLAKAGRRLFPFLYRVPDPYRGDAGRMKAAILKAWPSERFDRIITFAYPFSSHLLGLALKERFQCPWIAHFSDPWAGNPLMGYGPLSGRVNDVLEKRVVEAADRMVFVSEETAAFYRRRYPEQVPRMSVLEHSFDSALYQEPDAPPAPRGALTVRFLGNLYGGRTFEPVFRALSLMEEARGAAPEIRLELVLSHRRPLAEAIERHGLARVVSLRAPVDYRRSLGLMKSAGLLLVLDTPLPGSFSENLFFPSKLADYMGSRRPILALAGPGASRRIVAGYGGRVADPDDPAAIAAALKETLQDWRAGRLDAFSPSKDFWERYRVETKAAALEEVLR